MINFMHRERNLLAFVFMLFAVTQGAYAEEKLGLSIEAKIDTIYRMQKMMYEERNISPLKDKKYGIEINPVRLLFLGEMPSFSGTFSLFNVNRHAEIAFPFFYGGSNASQGVSEFDLDCHYRYFMGNNQKGFYLSGFLRYAHFHGYEDIENSDSYSYTITSRERSISRVGLGVGLGYRIFSRKGFYWGTGLIIGRYADAGYNLNITDASSLLWGMGIATPAIVEFELFKFGWAF